MTLTNTALLVWCTSAFQQDAQVQQRLMFDAGDGPFAAILLLAALSGQSFEGISGLTLN